MDLKILSIVWGVRNMDKAIAFWSQALDYRLKHAPDPHFAILLPKDGNGLQLSLKLASSEEPKRHHIDLVTKDQKAEVERLIGLGAKKMEHWEYEQDADYVVLLDPDDNSFCVVQA